MYSFYVHSFDLTFKQWILNWIIFILLAYNNKNKLIILRGNPLRIILHEKLYPLSLTEKYKRMNK